MTIDEAIEFLEHKASVITYPSQVEFRDAILLGAEALKMIKEGRSKPGGMFFHDLPGETKD